MTRGLNRKIAEVATKNNEHRVQNLHTASAAPRLEGYDWDDLRLFLKVAQFGSLRAAAEAGKVSVNTVRARVAKLEAACGAPLLRRTREGSTVTGAGAALLSVAREMQRAAGRAGGDHGRDVLVSPGEVRLFCSEGVGLLWLTPRLEALAADVGQHTVSLSLGYDLARDRSSEADVALTFRRPEDPDMIVTRLATLHFMMFASPAYLLQNGVPANLDEIRRHRLVEQASPGVNSYLADFIFGAERSEGSIPIRTNSSLVQLWAVANGAGIAPMPTYVRAITRSVVPVDPPLNLRFDLYCTYHGNARGTPAIEATVAWLRRCFDPQAYPWFRTEFVHPDDFVLSKGGEVVSLFDNLIDPAGRR